MTKMTDEELIAATARELGMKRDELASVAESPAGLVAVDRTGISIVRVDADNPDAEGKTGWMLLAAPEDYKGDYPVYALAADEELVAVDAVPDVYPVDGNAKAVLAWVGDDAERADYALDIERGSATARKGLTADLEAIVAAANQE